MEGGSSYNLYAKVPAEGGELALPFLEEAPQNITLGAEGSPGYSRLWIFATKELARTNASGDQETLVQKDDGWVCTEFGELERHKSNDDR